MSAETYRIEALPYYPPNKDEAAALDIAERYQRFPPIAAATEAMQGVLRERTHSPAFVQEIFLALEVLKRSVETLALSQKNQEDYRLVDKRWMRGPEFMREALEKGRLAMELDVRRDKDGEFWVSHATGAKASMTPPHIHELTTEEMRERGERFTVAEAFEIFSEYHDGRHKLILELKTLGPHALQFPEVVAKLGTLIDTYDLRDAVAISSLSPGILLSVHREMPDVPLILNGGIVPGVSYERPQTAQGLIERGMGAIRRFFLPDDEKWRAFGITLPWIGTPSEIVVSAGPESPIRPDGEGTQTGYALTRLPEDLVTVLQQQIAAGKDFGGMVSLSAVTILASVLETVGAHEKAAEMRRYYAEVVATLGLGVMATTWGQELATFPVLGETVFKHLAPEQQIAAFKRELGPEVMVYTKAPEDFAHHLPDFVQTYE